ncbi:MAG: hypothetical protein P4M02_03560, partial [Clostridia bacterium]|nr:hypothetical protein [Clostridia bacterium]
ESVQRLKDGGLDDSALSDALAHLSKCEACAERLADAFAPQELAEMPAGFAQHAVARANESIRSEKRQFALYTARVAVAACASLVITFSGLLNHSNFSNIHAAKVNPPDAAFINGINTKLQTFSQNLLNLEGFTHEKKEK